MPNPSMPGGSFSECLIVMQKQGKSEDSAKRICGAIQSKTEFVTNSTGFSYFELNEDEKKCVEQYTKVEEVKTYAEVEAEVFSSGQWNKDKYSDKDLQEMVQNFSELKDIVKPPAKIGHSESQDYLKKEGLPAAGWVDSLKMVGNKVVAHFKDVPKIVKDLIDKKAYKRVSAEIYPKYKNPANGKIYNNVLRAVAFLGAETPAVETLSDIAALYNMDTQDFKTYGFDLEGNNIIKQSQNKGGDTIVGKYNVSIEGASKDELVKKLSESLGEGVKVNVEDSAILDAEEQKKKEEEAKNKEVKDKKIEELSQQYEAVTKLQGDKDSKIKSLEEELVKVRQQLQDAVDAQTKSESDNAEMMKKMAEAEAATKMSAIKSFVKEQIGAGKLLPKDEEIVVALMGQLDDKVVKFSKDDKEVSEPVLDVLKKFISDRPKAVEFAEVSPSIEHKVYDSKISIGGVNYEVKDQDLVQKAEKYAQDNKVEFDVALMAVSKDKES